MAGKFSAGEKAVRAPGYYIQIAGGPHPLLDGVAAVWGNPPISPFPKGDWGGFGSLEIIDFFVGH
jgi:hypothetical protein